MESMSRRPTEEVALEWKRVQLEDRANRVLFSRSGSKYIYAMMTLYMLNNGECQFPACSPAMAQSPKVQRPVHQCLPNYPGCDCRRDKYDLCLVLGHHFPGRKMAAHCPSCVHQHYRVLQLNSLGNPR